MARGLRTVLWNINLNHKRRFVETAEAFKKRVKRNDDLQSAVKVPAILATVASIR